VARDLAGRDITKSSYIIKAHGNSVSSPLPPPPSLPALNLTSFPLTNSGRQTNARAAIPARLSRPSESAEEFMSLRRSFTHTVCVCRRISPDLRSPASRKSTLRANLAGRSLASSRFIYIVRLSRLDRDDYGTARLPFASSRISSDLRFPSLGITTIARVRDNSIRLRCLRCAFVVWLYLIPLSY